MAVYRLYMQRFRRLTRNYGTFTPSMAHVHNRGWSLNTGILKLIQNFFFHSFIGCSSSDIQYKFVIQHIHTHKKKKRRKNPKGVGATGLTFHARHRP